MLDNNLLVAIFTAEMYGPYKYLLWFVYLNRKSLFT